MTTTETRTTTETTTESRPTTTSPAPQAGTRGAQHVDVLIVGAGVSGLGAAHTLRERFPDRSFAILDARDNRGGTWWTRRSPGVRSDSDLFAYGYRHKPWRGPSIAAGGGSLASPRAGLGEGGRARRRARR